MFTGFHCICFLGKNRVFVKPKMASFFPKGDVLNCPRDLCEALGLIRELVARICHSFCL